MKTTTGSYVGTGVAHGIIGVGFQPDFVLVKSAAANESVFRSSSMGGTKQASSNAAFNATDITSLDADGFSIGTNARVNTNLVTYHYLAIRDDGVGDFKVSTYVGDGVDPHNIAGVGFQPDLVIICVDAGQFSFFKPSSLAGDASLGFGATAGVLTDRIQALQADGFQVGLNAAVNTNLTTYHYIAAKNVAGQFNAFTYLGDAADNRNINGQGMTPKFCLTKRDGATASGVRFGDEVGDLSLKMDASAEAADRIQDFHSDGFQIGTDASVNAASNYYGWSLAGNLTPPTPAGPLIHLLLKRRHWVQRDTAAPFL